MRFGNHLRFAIDCEIDAAQTSSLGVRGRLRISIGGYELGDFDYTQLLDDMLLVLSQTPPIQICADTQFEGMTSFQALDAVYRVDLGVSQKMRQYLVCPSLGTSFDGLYAIRLKYHNHDELVWRHSEETAAHGVILATGVFEGVVGEFESWLNSKKNQERTAK